MAKLAFGLIIAIFGLFAVWVSMLAGLEEAHVSGHIHVSGEVNTPGQFLIPGRSYSMEIQDAIALAGGYSAEANRERVEILRDSRRIPINAERMALYHSEGFRLVPGDTVVVTSAREW